MNILKKAWLTWHTLRWVLTWKKHDNHYKTEVPGNPKFTSAREAAEMIPDGAVICTSGLAGNQQCSVMNFAIRDHFLEKGTPKNLTIISLGGQGGRGKVPGTLEELGHEGLLTRLFTGHTETYKAELKMADKGQLELQCIPQGTIALLIKGQSEGTKTVINQTGIGTFVDPRTGRGTPVVDSNAPQYVKVVDGDRLEYTLPDITCCYFSATAADRKGNIYARYNSVKGEAREAARAAKRNGGVVIAVVGMLVDEGWHDVYVPAEDVDAIVCYPETYMTATIKYRKPWKQFTPESDIQIDEGVARIRYINNMLGITPRRREADNVLARLAASIFVEEAEKGDYTDIGVGLPEEVSRLLYESGAMEEYTMVNESGVYGGLPTPGIFFGGAVNPDEIISSCEAFTRIYERLDAAILGALEIDSEGNNNVSKRGDGAINYVGPGGFIDLTTCAPLNIFCASWGDGAKFDLTGGKMTVAEQGKVKFVDQVEEITFSGKEALKHGKKVFYVTHVGAFRLTERGMELYRVMQGIDIRKDIIDACSMKIVLPESGDVPVADDAIMTGKGFRLKERIQG
jgi:propionate CoA-transferase